MEKEGFFIQVRKSAKWYVKGFILIINKWIVQMLIWVTNSTLQPQKKLIAFQNQNDFKNLLGCIRFLNQVLQKLFMTCHRRTVKDVRGLGWAKRPFLLIRKDFHLPGHTGCAVISKGKSMVILQRWVWVEKKSPSALFCSKLWRKTVISQVLTVTICLSKDQRWAVRCLRG